MAAALSHRRPMMRTRLLAVLSVALLSLMVTPLLAHPFTYKGTVVSAEPTKITISVVDEKTKKPVEKAFVIDKDTKILRGDTAVTFAQAHIEKNEPVSLTTNLDDDEIFAEVVKLQAKKK
jgi:hypothetical protein